MRRLIGLYDSKMKPTDIWEKWRQDLAKLGSKEIDEVPNQGQTQVIFFKNKPPQK